MLKRRRCCCNDFFVKVINGNTGIAGWRKLFIGASPPYPNNNAIVKEPYVPYTYSTEFATADYKNKLLITCTLLPGGSGPNIIEVYDFDLKLINQVTSLPPDTCQVGTCLACDPYTKRIFYVKHSTTNHLVGGVWNGFDVDITGEIHSINYDGSNDTIITSDVITVEGPSVAGLGIRFICFEPSSNKLFYSWETVPPLSAPYHSGLEEHIHQVMATPGSTSTEIITLAGVSGDNLFQYQLFGMSTSTKRRKLVFSYTNLYTDNATYSITEYYIKTANFDGSGIATLLKHQVDEISFDFPSTHIFLHPQVSQKEDQIYFEGGFYYPSGISYNHAWAICKMGFDDPPLIWTTPTILFPTALVDYRQEYDSNRTTFYGSNSGPQNMALGCAHETVGELYTGGSQCYRND